MKKLIVIIIICASFVKPEKEVMQPRSFYAEMKALEKPPKVNAFAAVQTVGAEASGVSSFNISVSSTTANNLLVVSIWTGTSETVTSITDNQSSSYTTTSVSSAAGNVYQAYAISNAGVTSVTINLSGNTASEAAIVDEYSGNATSSVMDVQDTETGTGTSLAVSTITPSISGRLIVATLVGIIANTGGWTAGSGYTLYGQALLSSTFPIIRTQYKLSGTTSETAPATVSYLVGSDWLEIASAFKQATAPTNTTNFFNFFKP